MLDHLRAIPRFKTDFTEGTDQPVDRETPNFAAVTVVAPGVRFKALAIFATPAFALAIVFICRTSSFVHARRTSTPVAFGLRHRTPSGSRYPGRRTLLIDTFDLERRPLRVLEMVEERGPGPRSRLEGTPRSSAQSGRGGRGLPVSTRVPEELLRPIFHELLLLRSFGESARSSR
jgi:hypothetical protein